MPGRRNGWEMAEPRGVSLAVLLVETALACSLLFPGGHPVHMTFIREWIPRLGISFHLAIDGLSLILVILTAGIGIMAIVSSWGDSPHHPGFYYGNILWTIAGITGVFLAFDLFLLYVLWELMLIPLYFIILLWGRSASRAAGIQFIIFTQVSGLFMLLSILVLYFHMGMSGGGYTFDYDRLVMHARPGPCPVLGDDRVFHRRRRQTRHRSLPCMVARCVLRRASGRRHPTRRHHVENRRLRFCSASWCRYSRPESLSFSRIAMVLGVISVIYGAAVAIAQTDLRRLIAYSSISHMGFVLLAVGAWNEPSLQGAIVQIVSHAVIITALFILTDCLERRLHSTDMQRMGGLWESAPRMGCVMLLFVLASMGLPGLGSFVGEFLILLGSFRHSSIITGVAAGSGILSVIYALSMMHRVFQGPAPHGLRVRDLSLREAAILGLLSAAIITAGLYPQPILGTSATALATLRCATGPADDPLAGARP